MSTDQTPALARAARDLCLADTDAQVHELSHEYPCPACVEEAETAVSAALHDPDPDFGAKVLASFDSIKWSNMRRETKDIYRRMFDAVRAAIIGEAS